MKYFLSFLALVFSYAASYGQLTITSQSSCTSSTLTATLVGGAPTNTGLTIDDIWSQAFNIGFTFDYMGTNYTQCIIGTNGEIGFDLTYANSYNSWSIEPTTPANATLARNAATGGQAGDMHNLIAGAWCDLYLAAGGTVTYALVGTAPNRRFAVTFCGDGMYNQTYCPGQWTTEQIMLYETTNVVDVYIEHKTICTNWNGGYAECGVVNQNGSSCTMAPGPPVEDFPNTWTATQLAWRFTPNAAVTAYTVAAVPYAPLPLATSAIYWYDSATHAYLGTGASLVVTPTVTTTYFAAALGCKDTDKTYITVPAGGNAPITGILTICAGTSTTLSVASSGGTWSSSNNAVATIDSVTGIVTGLTGGAVTISYSGNLICTGTTPFTVVQPGPLPPTSICAGGTTTLSDSPAGGTWTSSNSSVATIGLTSGIATGVTTGTTNISYDVGAGCIATGPLTVVLLSGITGNTTVCQGNTITLNNAAIGGTWSSGNPAVATINLTSGVVTGVTPGTAQITYMVAGGCFVTTTVTVTPNDPITGIDSLCQRRAITTLSDASPGGTWSSGNPGIATITPVTGIVYGVTPGAGGVATISYTNTNGCISTIAVTVNPTPPAPIVTPVTYCQYYTPALQLTANGAGPTFTWWGPGVTAGTAIAPTPSTALPGVTDYYVTQTSSSGCESDSAMEPVTIIPKPAPPITDSVSYCQFFPNPASLNTQVDSSAGSTLNWYDGSGNALNEVPQVITNTATYPNGTTWYVAQTINGCEGDSAAVNVDIIPKPVFTITAQPWVCQFDSITLSYSGSPLIEGGYLWSLPMGATAVNGTSITDQTIYAQFDLVNGNNYVYLTANDLNGQCTTTDTILIDVIQLPTANAYSKADVCLSDTVTLALSSKAASAINFNWYIDNSPLFSSPAATVIAANSNNGGPYSIRWTDTGMHVIYVQAFTEHGCTDNPSADTVDVHGLPDASFNITTRNGTLCLEDSVLFSANNSNYQNNYSWAPVLFFGDNNIDKPQVWGKVDLTQSIVTLTITDPFGCVASSSRELDPSACCNIVFPNSFSPNGDTHNDVFRPVPSTAYHIYHKFVIENRWGQVVFESANNQASWDGTFNGVPQDIGVYYYYLKYDCNGNTIEQKGDVTLVR